MWWNENDAFVVAEHHISGHDNGLPNLDRDVDTNHYNFTDGSGVCLLEEDLGGEFTDAPNITNGSIDYRPGAGPPGNRRLQVVSAKVMPRRGSHQVDYRNIIHLKQIDHLLILPLWKAFSFRVRIQHFRQIGP